jgi:hypothetical protein
MVDGLMLPLEDFDPSVFRVESQTSDADKRSLLCLQDIVRNRDTRYTYLEVGSHVGGTIFPHLIDPHCDSVVSLDPRPVSLSDERGRSMDYDGNSTARMISFLERIVPPDAMLKLQTHDIDASQIASIGDRFRATLALIDAEHTNRAVFRDFLFILPYMESDAIVAFHDSNLVFDALMNIETFLAYSGHQFSAFYLPDNVYAVALGELTGVVERRLRRDAFDAEKFTTQAKDKLHREIAESELQRTIKFRPVRKWLRNRLRRKI